MSTNNNEQQSQPGPVAQQLTKLQSNGHQTSSNGQQLPIGQPPKKTSNWTGFGGRTLWDWIQFFAVLALPIIVAAGTLYYTQQITLQQTQLSDKQHQIDQQTALDQQRQTTLTACLDNIRDLLLSKGLKTSQPNDNVRVIARAEVLSALRQLDGERKGILIRFLSEAGLITDTKKNNDVIIDLSGADLANADLKSKGATIVNKSSNGFIVSFTDTIDLRGANLIGADLSSANLSNDYLDGAQLETANLTRANLSFAFLLNANLGGASLKNALLVNAFLTGADFNGANLTFADLAKTSFNNKADFFNNVDFIAAKPNDTALEAADLSKANLIYSDVTQTQLAPAYSLQGATMPDGSIHP